MGLVTRALSSMVEARSATTLASSPAGWLLDAVGAGPTASGARVSEKNAARVSTIFACVRTISEDVGRLPFDLFERTPTGRQKAIDHPLWELLTTRSSPELTSHAFRELLTSHAALWGAGYAEIELDMVGRPIALWPLLPNVTRAVRRGGRKYILTRLPDTGEDVALPPGRYLHIPGPSWMGDGLEADHPVQMARETIGIMMAAEEFGARLFGSGARPSGILTNESKTKLTEDQRAEVMSSWNAMVSGLKNSQRTALLEANLKFTPLSINPDDAQSLETRKFEVEEAARYYRMPLFMIGHTEKATTWGTGLEQIVRGYLSQTLGSWLTRWETWVAFYMLSGETRRYYLEHQLADFLKADIKTRFEAYGMAVDKGWMNRNEVRAKENMNRIEGPGGDMYTIQLAMEDIDRIAGGSDGGLRRIPESSERRSLRKAAPPEPIVSRWSFVDAWDGRMVMAQETEAGEVVLSWTTPGGRFMTEEHPAAVGQAGAEELVTERADALRAQLRSLRARHRLRNRFRGVFEQTFGRVVRRETGALRRLSKRLDPDAKDPLSIEAFHGEVEGFYELDALRNDRDPSEHMEWAGAEYTKPLTSYAELIQDELLEERGVDEKPDAADIDVLMGGYIKRFLRRHGARSANQLRQLVVEIEDANEARELIDARLDEWDEKRATKMANEEAVHSSGSVTRMTYFAVGVLSIEWVAFGENCPLCDELNGQVVGVQEVFLEKGDTVDPDDGETQPLTTQRAILNPPLHNGCDCDLTAA